MEVVFFSYSPTVVSDRCRHSMPTTFHWIGKVNKTRRKRHYFHLFLLARDSSFSSRYDRPAGRAGRMLLPPSIPMENMRSKCFDLQWIHSMKNLAASLRFNEKWCDGVHHSSPFGESERKRRLPFHWNGLIVRVPSPWKGGLNQTRTNSAQVGANSTIKIITFWGA